MRYLNFEEIVNENTIGHFKDRIDIEYNMILL